MRAASSRLLRNPRAARRQQGFVLALTLWILAAIMIAATVFADRVHQAVELARRQQLQTAALLDIKATQAEIMFRLGVTPISLYGLGDEPDGKSIFLDNRKYRGAGATTVQLQDDRGLLNLNIVGDDRLLRLLAIVEVPAEKRGMLLDCLHDYTDEDSLKRVNGAEEPEYRALGLPPPRNEKLLTPYEAKNIIGWRDQPQLWENNRLPDLTSTSNAVAVNPNTAPKEVLETLPGVTSEIADAIIQQRQLGPIADIASIAQMAGAAPGDYQLNIITLPADSVRVTHRSADLPWAIQYNVSLQPNNDKMPWRIDYYFKVRQSAQETPPAAATPAPANPTSLPTGLGQATNNANDIAELPPRHTLAAASAASILFPTR
jgi:general secretion pathway protein K